MACLLPLGLPAPHIRGHDLHRHQQLPIDPPLPVLEGHLYRHIGFHPLLFHIDPFCGVDADARPAEGGAID
jgi:hypothetical protein